MAMPVLTAILAAMITCLATTPLSMWLAARIGATDEPGAIKIHSSTMPRLGGLAIFVSSVVGLIAGLISTESLLVSAIPLLLGSAVIALVGMTDDVLCIRPSVKVLGGILAAATYVMVSRLLGFTQSEEIATTMLVVTVLTIGLSNSFNLLDGMDGILAGTTAIVTAGGWFLSVHAGEALWQMAFVSCFGACLAFLVFNFPPAKTFMGDGGSLFLGYWVAIGVYELGFSGLIPSQTAWRFALLLGVPIADTAFAIVRRIRSGRSISGGDRRHLYDRIHTVFGQSVVQTNLLTYFLSIICVAVGLYTTARHGATILLLAVIGVYTFLFLFGGWLGALRSELPEVRRPCERKL